MVTLEEQFQILTPVIVGLIVALVTILVTRHIKGLDKTSQNATMATFNIGSMKDEVKEIKDQADENKQHFDKRLDSMTSSLEKRDKEFWEEFRAVQKDIRDLMVAMGVAESRLDRIDKNRGAAI